MLVAPVTVLALTMPNSFWEWLVAGTGPNYATGLVALVAAVFAYRSSNASRTSANAASRQLAILEKDKDMAQAAGVSAWTSSYVQLAYENVYRVYFEFQNLSPVPIYNVSFYYVNKPIGQGGKYYQFGNVMVPPKSRQRAEVKIVMDGPMSTYHTLGATFMDSQQRYWNRKPFGELELFTFDSYCTFSLEASKNTEAIRRTVQWNTPTEKQEVFQVSVTS